MTFKVFPPLFELIEQKKYQMSRCILNYQNTGMTQTRK